MGFQHWNANSVRLKKKENADLLRKHGGKTSEELKAEGKWKKQLFKLQSEHPVRGQLA